MEGQKRKICYIAVSVCGLWTSVCASFLWRQHQAGKAGKEEDEQRDSFLGGRKLDRLCISEKREVRRNTRDQQLTAEIEMCEEHFLLSESWVGSPGWAVNSSSGGSHLASCRDATRRWRPMYTWVQTASHKPGLRVANAILHALLTLVGSQMTLLQGEAPLE